MIDETTLAQMNGAYAMPPDAGPAWRAAAEAGIDMFELESNLKLSPEERLEKHQRVLNRILKIEDFVEKLNRGKQLPNSFHVHPRHA